MPPRAVAGPGLTLAQAAALSPQEAVARLGSSSEGLAAAEAARRPAQFGPDQLGAHRVRTRARALRPGTLSGWRAASGAGSPGFIRHPAPL